MKTKEKMDAYDLRLIERIRGKKIIVNVASVSKSGMTRKMDFYIYDDGLIKINHIIRDIADYSLDKNHRVIVGGCGMDMIFSVLAEFNHAMTKFDTGKTLQELMQTRECGERIYDKYFINANNYQVV